MRVDHVSFGPFVNASEERACQYLSRRLMAEPGDARFVILTNVAHSITSGGQPDEIDIVLVGPSGVHVVEVKHWDRAYARSNRDVLAAEADKIAQKVRKVATKLRRTYPDLGYVVPKMLLTKEQKTLQRDTDEPIRGVRLYALTDWRGLVDLDDLSKLPATRIDRLCDEIAPRSRAVLSGELRRLGQISDLALLSPREDRFHRIYRGRNTINQDQIVGHVYDLSASEHENPIHLARREFEVVQRMQKSPWLPRLVDSFQPVPNYPGELFFFSLADSSAPTLRARTRDAAWALEDRVEFARQCLVALDELHHPASEEEGVIHRTITPDAVLTRPDGRPLFFHWEWARIPEAQTIASSETVMLTQNFAAPEVLAEGLSAADRRSDVFALCASLLLLFEGIAREEAQAAAQILAQGTAADPQRRPSLMALAELLGQVSTKPRVGPAAEPAQTWVEEGVVNVDGHRYRVLGRLGAGGTGQTFKVEQFDPTTDEEFGTYVAKVVSNPEVGVAALRSYKLARPHTKHTNLARIYSTAVDWQPDAALALLEWVEGTPLRDYTGVLELYAEELGETDVEALLLTWIGDLCGALAKFHEIGLVHGDVSPGNVIVEGSAVTLIDYDLVTKVGEVVAAAGTPPYAAANLRDGKAVAAADDLFALAATFFHVLTDRDPFLFDGVRAADRGLAWTPALRDSFPRIALFLDRAVSPDPRQRFANAIVGAAFLRELAGEVAVQTHPSESPRELPLTPNEVPWLREILTAYPGSRYGNLETRGLDSKFSEQTYVETDLDNLIYEEIQCGQIALVILCGNAGDGKTAFLQHLAARLELPRLPSSQRIWEVALANGIKVKANLDGAAAWQGRSADELLDEIFSPFHQGQPAARIAHIVAVNDGRLMEWVEGYENRNGPTRLTEQIAERLGERADVLDPHIRLVELNLRSLVGGFTVTEGFSTRFLESLFARVVGGGDAQELWGPCLTCSAQSRCAAWRSAGLLGASEVDSERRQGALLRERLSDVFQVVHQRNEIHITTRELKAAVSYILFGTRYCTDIHADPNQALDSPWDLAFDPGSPLRQGELLREFTRLDPALEAHPRIDRYLLGRGVPDPEHGAPRYPELTLQSARRRAYLEWTEAQIEAVGGAPDALRLAGARHFRRFRDFPALRAEDRARVCRDLCTGLSRLEDLPPAALKRSGAVPIRIVPRTPTETALWVERPFDRFALAPEQFVAPQGLETLHRYLVLSYQAIGGRKEPLTIPFELFALLLDLKDGMQLIDTLSDDVFANIGVFAQRLAQEDERHSLAWNPVAEETVYELGIRLSDKGQVIWLAPATP